jgi:hypothetical protein
MVTLAYIIAIGFALFFLATNDLYYLILGLIASFIAITGQKE